MSVCKICGNGEENKNFNAREMMQGTRAEFEYMECSACGCVQIINIPADMGEYYSNSSYGSFIRPNGNSFKVLIRRLRNKHAIFGNGGLMGIFLNAIMPLPPDYFIVKDYAQVDSKILDIGCGAGSYIHDLREIGYLNLNGIDPFLEKDIVYDNGVVIKKMLLEHVIQRYDLILSHHSFEHVPDPLETLASIKNILHSNGVCLLTIPVAEDLYRQYQSDCYLIQAPQHFFLYSIKSMEILVQKAGLYVEKVVRHPASETNWNKYSELWKRNISCDEAGKNLNKHFSLRELAGFAQALRDLNRCGNGDNVTFVLRHKR